MTGTWSGGNFVATCNLWGVLTKRSTISATAEISNIVVTGAEAGDEGLNVPGRYNVVYKINGTAIETWNTIETTINLNSAYNTYYNEGYDDGKVDGESDYL